ncbi:MAG: hypothetical protein AABN34_02915 [Acidobacteriota bacterium]
MYEEVKAGRASQLPAAFSDTKIATLQTKLDELKANLEKLDLKYGQEHPLIVEAKLQIKSTEAQLESSRKALAAKVKGEYELAFRDEQSLVGLPSWVIFLETEDGRRLTVGHRSPVVGHLPWH